MPRLLSNKEPKKITEVRVWKKSELKVEEKPKPKSEDEMTAWECYSFLMRFGKRKMDRFEWRIWKSKKDEEDWNKKYIKNEEGRFVKRISSKEFYWRIKKDPDFDERLCMIDNNLK